MNSRRIPRFPARCPGAALPWLALACLLLAPCHLRADLEATNLWAFSFDRPPYHPITLSTPAVGTDGTVYFGTFDGYLYALTPEGAERWEFQAGREVKSSPAVADDGTIYFGSRDRHFYAVTPEGKLKWKFTTGAWIDSSAAIATNGTVYFGSWDKNFYALHPDGSLKWKFAVGSIIDSSPAIGVDGTIYFGAHDKKFYALDDSGKVRWTFPTGAEITSSPAIDDAGNLYFSSTDGNLYRLKSNGIEVWHCRIGGGSDSSPVLAENGNIVISAGKGTYIVSPSGAIVWHWPAPVWMDTSAVVVQGTVFFSQPWRQIWACQPDGSGLWVANLDDNLTTSPVIGSQGVIYFCTGARKLEAIEAPVALVPARSPWPMFRGNSRHNGRVNVD